MCNYYTQPPPNFSNTTSTKPLAHPHHCTPPQLCTDPATNDAHCALSPPRSTLSSCFRFRFLDVNSQRYLRHWRALSRTLFSQSRQTRESCVNLSTEGLKGGKPLAWTTPFKSDNSAKEKNQEHPKMNKKNEYSSEKPTVKPLEGAADYQL